MGIETEIEELLQVSSYLTLTHIKEMANTLFVLFPKCRILKKKIFV